MNNLISVLLPSKNAGKYIKKSVESILSQTYQNIELIIIDESIDDTENIVSSFYSDKIIYRKVYDSNISKSLNLALKLARGDIVARMDADDISHPERLEIQFQFINKHKNINVVGTNFYFINRTGEILHKKKLPEHHERIEYWMPILSTILHPTIMTYKNILYNINGYSIKYNRAEDIDLFFRLIQKHCKFYNIQKYLYYYRINVNSKETISLTREIFKNLSYKYIEQKYEHINNKHDNFDKNYKLALLEYYHGKMSISRKFLFKALWFNPLKIVYISRYLIFTLLGTKLMTKLREKGIISFISKILNKFTKYNSPGI